jgi:hypothetical protein
VLAIVEARRWAGAVLALGLAATSGIARTEDLATSSEDVRPAAAEAEPSAAPQVARWVLASSDNGGLPFVVVDKRRALVSVYDSEGLLVGAAPALLGLAAGDGSAPGVGDRALSAIRPDERTTPAGRFVASYGAASGQKKVLWIDYATAISLHPVITSEPKERRPERLSTPTAEDNRITYGCINVSGAFYREVVASTIRDRAIVYILPDVAPLESVFPGYHLWAQTNAAMP